MNSIKKTILFSLLCFTKLALTAQLTTVYVDADNYYEQGMSLYDMDNFGLAKKSFKMAEKELAYQFDTRSQLLKRKAMFMIAKSALDGSFPEGEK